MSLHSISLFVMIDALGGRFLRDHEFLPEFEYRTSLRTVLGYSSSCEPTILTGRLPREHGHGGMFLRRSGANALDLARPLRLLPGFIRDNHRVRARLQARVGREIEGYFSLYECPVELLPRFELVEPRCIFRPGGIRRGPGIFDVLEELRIPWTSYWWNRSEEENLARVEDDIRSGRVPWIFLYLPRLDGLLHEHGLGGAAVVEHLRWLEQRIRRLISLAGRSADNVECYVFSDHGMSDVHGSVDLMRPIERQFGKNGKRYLAFYDSTMMRAWADDGVLRAELAGAMSELPGGRLLPAEEIAAMGCDIPDRAQGDLIFVVEEGLLILPSYMGRQPLAAMHGYHPDAQYADACFLGLTTPPEQLGHLKDIYLLLEGSARSIAGWREDS